MFNSVLRFLDNEQLKLTRLGEVAEANFNRRTSGKQPARTWTAEYFRQKLSTLGAKAD